MTDGPACKISASPRVPPYADRRRGKPAPKLCVPLLASLPLIDSIPPERDHLFLTQRIGFSRCSGWWISNKKARDSVLRSRREGRAEDSKQRSRLVTLPSNLPAAEIKWRSPVAAAMAHLRGMSIFASRDFLLVLLKNSFLLSFAGCAQGNPRGMEERCIPPATGTRLCRFPPSPLLKVVWNLRLAIF